MLVFDFSDFSSCVHKHILPSKQIIHKIQILENNSSLSQNFKKRSTLSYLSGKLQHTHSVPYPTSYSLMECYLTKIIDNKFGINLDTVTINLVKVNKEL